MHNARQTLHRAAFGGKPKRGFEALSSSESEGHSDDDISDDAISDYGISYDGAGDDGVSDDGVSDVSDNGVSDDGVSDDDSDGNSRPRQRSRLNPLTGSSPTPPSVWETGYTEEGRPYYKNYYTGETTWDKPAGFVDTVDPGITSTELTDTDGVSDVDDVTSAPAATAADSDDSRFPQRSRLRRLLASSDVGETIEDSDDTTDSERKRWVASAVPVAVPAAVPVAEGPARPIYMYRFWSCEIKNDPHGKGRMQFFEDTKHNTSLCGHDATYFTNRKPDGTEIWLMHDDVDAAARDAFPPLSSAVALGNTSGNYLAFRCIVPGRGWGGLGKLLFNVLCAHMQALGEKEINNVPANDALQKYYETEYGMTCGRHMCKKSLPIAGLPDRLIPLQTHVEIMSAAEAKVSKAAALAKQAAKATATAAAGGETTGGIRRKQTLGKLWWKH